MFRYAIPCGPLDTSGYVCQTSSTLAAPMHQLSVSLEAGVKEVAT
jgi:hypothetical protein